MITRALMGGAVLLLSMLGLFGGSTRPTATPTGSYAAPDPLGAAMRRRNAAFATECNSGTVTERRRCWSSLKLD